MDDQSSIDWSKPDPNRTYSPEELGVAPTHAAPSAFSSGIDWNKPDPNKTYSAEELGVTPQTSEPSTPQPNKGADEYEARVQKYMPEASKVLAPKSSIDYVPGVKQSYAAITSGLGLGEGQTFGERYQNSMAKQEAYQRAKQQDEERRVQEQTPGMFEKYNQMSPTERSLNAGATSFFNLPILGTLASKAGAAGAAGGLPSWVSGYEGDTSGQTFNERYLNNLAKKQAAERLLAEKNPISTIAGGIAQAPLLPGGGAEKLGEIAGLGAGYGLAESAAQGENPFLGAGIGGAGAGAGHALMMGLGNTGKFLGTMWNPTNPAKVEAAAKKQFGEKYLEDLARAPKDDQGNVISPKFLSVDDMEKQRAMGQKVMGADIGAGSMARAARVEGVGNAEFASQMESALLERQSEQKQTMQNMFKNLYGKEMDPVQLMTEAKETAKQANTPNYQAIFNNPDAKAIWNPQLEQITKLKDFPALAQDAYRKLELDYLSQGKTPPKPPLFEMEAPPPAAPLSAKDQTRVSMGLKPKDIAPSPEPQLKNQFSLEFWDAIKRAAQDKGYQSNDANFKQIGNLVKDALGPKNLGDLGSQYHNTLATAKKYFDQKDAFTAGQQLSKTINSVKRSELLNNIKSYSPAERQQLEHGFVSEAMDKVLNSTNANAMTRMLDAPNTKAIFDTVVSPEKAPQIEAFLRTQNIMNKAKQVITNQSRTAENMVDFLKGKAKGPVGKALGLGALEGASELYENLAGHEEGMGGHLNALMKAGAMAFIAHRYMKFTGARSEALQKLLLSEDPATLRKAIESVSNSPPDMQFLRKIDRLTSKSMAPLNDFMRNYLSPSYSDQNEPPREGRKDGGASTSKPRNLFKEIMTAMRAHKKNTQHTLTKHDNEIASTLQHIHSQVKNGDPIHN